MRAARSHRHAAPPIGLDEAHAAGGGGARAVLGTGETNVVSGRRADLEAGAALGADETNLVSGGRAGAGAGAVPSTDEAGIVSGGRAELEVAVSSTDEVAAVRGAGRLDPGVVLRADEVPRHAVRLVVVAPGVDPGGYAAPPRLAPFAALPQLLRAGDLVVVNDAATLPASLPGRTADGGVFELRLSGPVDAGRLSGVLLGPGDHRTRTEHRLPPPRVREGDRVTIAGMVATVASAAGRRAELVARVDADALWQALYATGAPVQYAHRSERLPLGSVQTAYAGRPWAAEMPSAGRPLTWEILLGLRRAGIAVAPLTHAAGLSSTGDDALDRVLPWPERYEIPRRTAELAGETCARGGRVIAIGTSVVRALEAAADTSRSIRPGSGIATLRLDAGYRPRVVSGLVSGLHVPGESHFELLSAFAPVGRLRQAIALAARHGLSSHELGDACLIAPG